jgi:molybdopterin biosynthesis enzyme
VERRESPLAAIFWGLDGELRPYREAFHLFVRAYFERVLGSTATVSEAARRARLERSHFYQLARRHSYTIRVHKTRRKKPRR